MHMDKIACGSEAGLMQHNSRVRYNNPSIDKSRFYLNYNLTSQDGRTDMQRFKDRLAQCSYRKQKNNVRMESIVITAPKNIKDKDIPLFFTTAHGALQGLTGGPENEISSWVHGDEHHWHMHYCFVPAVEVNGVLKLSARRLMDRSKLRILHPTVQSAVNNTFKHDLYKLVADNPAERGQSSDTLKIYKAKQAEIDRLEQQERQGEAFLALSMEQQADAQKIAVQATQQATKAKQEVQQAQARAQQIKLDAEHWEERKEKAKQQYVDYTAKTAQTREQLDVLDCHVFSRQQDIEELTQQRNWLTKKVHELETVKADLLEYKKDWDDWDMHMFLVGCLEQEYPDYYAELVAAWKYERGYQDNEQEQEFDLEL